MNGIWFGIQSVGISIVSILNWFLGGLDAILLTLAAFIIVSFTTGLISTIMEKKFSIQKMLIIIVRKIVILLLVGICHLMDMYLLGGYLVLRSAIIVFYISAEGISILQDASNIGLPIPQNLKKILTYLGNKSEENLNQLSDVNESKRE